MREPWPPACQALAHPHHRKQMVSISMALEGKATAKEKPDSVTHKGGHTQAVGCGETRKAQGADPDNSVLPSSPRRQIIAHQHTLCHKSVPPYRQTTNEQAQQCKVGQRRSNAKTVH